MGGHCRLGGGDNWRILVLTDCTAYLEPRRFWFCLRCIAMIDHPMFDTTEETLDQSQSRVQLARSALPQSRKKKIQKS